MKSTILYFLHGFLLGLTCLSQSFATEVRFLGMGHLSLVVEDETNQINLYRFGDNVAGALKDEETSTASGDFSFAQQKSKTAGKIDSLRYTAFGQAFPKSLREYTPFELLAGELDFPIFNLPGNSITWIQRKTGEERNIFGEVSRPQAYGMNFSYSTMKRDSLSKQYKETVNTPQVEIFYNQNYSERISWGLKLGGFQGKYKHSETKDEVSLTNFGAGLGGGFSFAEKLWLGLVLDGHLPKFEEVTTSFGRTDRITYSGTGFRTGLQTICNIARLKAGGRFAYHRVKTKGKTGTFSVDSFEGMTRVLYNLLFIPVKLGGMCGYDRKKPVDKDDVGRIDYQAKVSTFLFGSGAGLKVPLGTVGAEYHLESRKIDDVFEDTTISGKNYEINIGAEFNLVKTIFLRVGYIVGQEDPDIKVSKNEWKSNTITAGIGVDILQKIKADFAYNHIVSKPKDNPNGKEVKENVAMLTVKVKY
ncbi:MAG: hypothetical protein AB1393_01605 [Candidatus Edwardsbacteria bacterium]